MEQKPENITNKLIVSFLNGKATDEEIRQIEIWLNLSPENKKHLEDLKIIWAETQKLNPVPVNVDVDAAWNKLSARIDKNDNSTILIEPGKKRPHLLYSTLLKIAAVFIPILVIAYMYFSQHRDAKQIALMTKEQTMEKVLPDGSTIRLNAHSKLNYPQKFNKNTREVSLEGEAFFEIKPNKEKPFIIHSSEANIQVVGTSFNVKSYPGTQDVEVIVKTGRVRLFALDKMNNDTSSVYLLPGEKGIFNKKTSKTYKVALAGENDLFWMTRTLVFNKTKLTEVIESLNKNYNVHIKMNNSKLSQLRLSATFRNQSIDSVIVVISSSLNLKVIKTKSTYEINGEGN